MANATHEVDPVQPAADGKAARDAVPRSRHGEWEPASRDPLRILTAQDATRIPELVPIRYGRMLASPFAFFRGAAAMMAADLSRTPTTDLSVQLCGDAHLANFGVFASPDRRLVFDSNDFDETCPGPFEWDVKRLAASVASPAGSAASASASGSGRRSPGSPPTARRCAVSPRCATSMSGTPASTSSRGWRPSARRPRAPLPPGRAQPRQGPGQGQHPRPGQLTHERDGELRIVSDPPLITPLEDLTGAERAEQHLQRGARRLPGLAAPDRRRLPPPTATSTPPARSSASGSVGTRAWIVLLLGKDSSDPLFLQAKEAQASVLEPYAGRAPTATTAAGSSRGSG